MGRKPATQTTQVGSRKAGQPFPAPAPPSPYLWIQGHPQRRSLKGGRATANRGCSRCGGGGSVLGPGQQPWGEAGTHKDLGVLSDESGWLWCPDIKWAICTEPALQALPLGTLSSDPNPPSFSWGCQRQRDSLGFSTLNISTDPTPEPGRTSDCPFFERLGASSLMSTPFQHVRLAGEEALAPGMQLRGARAAPFPRSLLPGHTWDLTTATRTHSNRRPAPPPIGI